MKAWYLAFLLPAMLGCKPAAPLTTTRLTAAQAGALAHKLANDRAQVLYQCQPFRADSPAEFVEGRWVWHNLRGQGRGDLEATVELTEDGSKSSVLVRRLDSGLIREFR